MEKEMKEAEKREEEWRKTRLSMSNASGQVNGTNKQPTADPVKKTTEVKSEKSKPNGQVAPVKELPVGTKVVKSSDATVLIAKESADLKKNEVVNANRVKRRKSNLALMWEAKAQ